MTGALKQMPAAPGAEEGTTVDPVKVLQVLKQQIARLHEENAILSVRVEDLIKENQRLKGDK